MPYARPDPARSASVRDDIREILEAATGPLTISQIHEALGPHRPSRRFVMERLNELAFAGEITESWESLKLGIGKYSPHAKMRARAYQIRRTEP